MTEEAKRFCDAWEMPHPKLIFSTSPNRRSEFQYDPGDRLEQCLVIISHSAAQRYMRGGSAADFLLSARLTLFHELTHAVQYSLKNSHWMLQNKLLVEAHADIFGGYWVTSELRVKDIETVSKIAFAKGGTKRKGSHPPSCVRKNLASNGVQMGIRMLDIHRRLDVPDSSRLELFEDSLNQARRILDGRERPCLFELDSAREGRERLCPVCPLTQQVGEKRKRVAALLGACNPKARMKRLDQ